MVNEEREGPFQDITFSDQEEASGEVSAIDNDGDGDDDMMVDVERTIINVTFLSPSNFVSKRLSSNNRLPRLSAPLEHKI